MEVSQTGTVEMGWRMPDTRNTTAGYQSPASASAVDESMHCDDEYLRNDRTYDDNSVFPVGAWRYPPLTLRIALVAAVWMLPGVLVGLMADLVVPFTSDPIAAGFLGAVLGGTVGVWLEAWE
jgi:hypothetical protein